MLKRFIFVLTALTACCVVTFAQRTVQGSSAITFAGDYSFSSGGLSVDFCYYTFSGMFKTGVSAVDHRGVLSSGEKFSWPHIVATGDYLFRLAGTRNRAFNVYIGGGTFLGCEFVDMFKEIPETTVTDAAGNRFLIGVDAQTELELYLTPHSGLCLMVRCPYDFCSAIRKFNPEVALGFKYNF